MNNQPVTMDLHIHCPDNRVQTLIALAQKRGLNTLGLVDYASAKQFDRLARNTDQKGHSIFSDDWSIESPSPELLKVSSESGDIYLPRSQEVRAKFTHADGRTTLGDILAIGIEKSITPERDLFSTAEEIFGQGGIVGFAHPCAPMFYGFGEEIFKRFLDKFDQRSFPVFLEKNAQVPERWFNYNEKAAELSRKTGASLVGNSDSHGSYLMEHRRVGRSYYSVAEEIVPNPQLVPNLRRALLSSPPAHFEIMGTYNSLFRNAAWNIHSTLKNPIGKLTGTSKGLIQGKK